MIKKKKNLIRKISGVAVATVMTVTSVMLSLSGSLITALAADTSVSEAGKGTYFQINRNGVHDWNVPLYTTEDGSTIFCVEYEYQGPDTDVSYDVIETSHLSDEATNGVEAILLAYNEGNVTAGLTDEAAETVTAVAIKKFLSEQGEFGSGSSYGLHNMILKKNGCEAEWNAMENMVSIGRNNMNKTQSALKIQRDITKDVPGTTTQTYGFTVNSNDYDITCVPSDNATAEIHDGWFTVTVKDPTIPVRVRADGVASDSSSLGIIFYQPADNDSLQVMASLGPNKKHSYDTTLIGAADGNMMVAGGTGTIEAKKTDRLTGEPLRNALIGVYLDAACSEDKYLGQIVTDSDGTAQMDGLPEGTYYVKEEAAPARYMNDDTAVRTVNVTENNTSYVSFSNTPYIAQLQFNKTSATTKRPVKGAKFGIYDLSIALNDSALKTSLVQMFDLAGYESSGLTEQDKAVAMLQELIITGQDIPNGHTVNDFLYEEVISDANGLCTTTRMVDNRLIAGHQYFVIELEAADGYARSEESCSFTFGSGDYDSAAKSAMTVLAQFEGKWANFELPGKVSVKKTDENGNSILGAVFGIYTDPECTKPAHYVFYDTMRDSIMMDYDKIEAAGDTAIQLNASYALYDDAPATVNGNSTSGMLMSGIYYMKEITAPVGYEKTDVVQMFAVGGNRTEPILSFVNKPIKNSIIVSKTDSTNAGKFLEGAVYGLFDSSKNLIEKFSPTNEFGKARINNLALGTYYVKELQAPEGYDIDNEYHAVTLVAGNPIVVNVSDPPLGSPKPDPTPVPPSPDPTPDPTPVVIETVQATPDEPYFNVIKVSEDGAALAGAKLQIIDVNNQVVDEWISDGTVHIVKGVLLGSAYRLHEVSAPAGYELAEDIVFILPTTMEEVLTIHMVDKANCGVNVEKIDEENNAVIGAVLAVYDMDGNEITRWTTDGSVHTVYGVVPGATYLLREVETPEGYAEATDILFTAENGCLVSMVDYTVVQTGDFTSTILFLVAIIACGVVALLLYRRKRVC